MKHRNYIFLLVGLLVFLAVSRPPTPPPEAPSKPTPSLPAPLPKPALLLFGREGCAPCRTMEQSFRDDAVKALVAERFVFSDVQYPDPRFAEHGVTMTPTLIAVTHRGGKRHVGALDAAELKAWLEAVDLSPIRCWRPFWRPFRPAPKPKPNQGRIVEAGYEGPGGRKVVIDFPTAFWKANITSCGEGCCVFRSIDFSAHWQTVPVLYGFPEWLRSHNMPGSGWSGNVDTRIADIAKERKMPEPDYINVESGNDYGIIKRVIGTGRLPVVGYSGNDGVHYDGPIAHMVTLVYADDEYVAILDNNFPPDKLLWMPVADYRARWDGWIVALLAPRPPHAPRN